MLAGSESSDRSDPLSGLAVTDNKDSETSVREPLQDTEEGKAKEAEEALPTGSGQAASSACPASADEAESSDEEVLFATHKLQQTSIGTDPLGEQIRTATPENFTELAAAAEAQQAPTEE